MSINLTIRIFKMFNTFLLKIIKTILFVIYNFNPRHFPEAQRRLKSNFFGFNVLPAS